MPFCKGDGTLMNDEEQRKCFRDELEAGLPMDYDREKIERVVELRFQASEKHDAFVEKYEQLFEHWEPSAGKPPEEESTEILEKIGADIEAIYGPMFLECEKILGPKNFKRVYGFRAKDSGDIFRGLIRAHQNCFPRD